MSRLFAFLIFCLISTLSPGQELIITNIYPIDVVNSRSGPLSDVVIEQGNIVSVNPHQENLQEPSSPIIDGEGQFLIPGFIDGHIHFFQSGGLYTRPDAIDLRAYRPYEQELQEVWSSSGDFMRRYLAAGITSVCDVGGPMKNYEVRAMGDSVAYAPNIFVTGPLISTYAPSALQTEDSPILKANNPEEARQMVRDQLASQPDFIKIWFIVFPDQSASDSRPLIEAVMEESHLHDIPVAVHATELETARIAVEAGADILVHSVRDQEVDARFIQLLLENNVSYIPTLIVGENYSRTFRQQPRIGPTEHQLANPFFLGSLLDLRHLPGTAIPSWMSSGADMMKRRDSAQLAIMNRNLKVLFDAGVNVVTGTDAGNIGTQHASSYYHELQYMQTAGLSPAQILQASTINGADMLGLEHRSGQIAPGMMADLVIVKHNPLDSIPGPEDLTMVIKEGRALGAPADLLPSTPEILAQRQLNAYNDRDLEAFLACYSDDVELYEFPNQPMGSGKEYMAQIYGRMFERVTELHCELVNRMVIGEYVIDEERVSGFGGNEVIHATAIYQIEDGLIKKVWFLQ